MKSRNCIPLDTPELTTRIAGGKAAALASLMAAGAPVPAGFVVPAGTTHASVDARQTDILASFDALDARFVAVRSSAVAEDGTHASWAGQLETVLGVTRTTLIDAIHACLNSATSDHATAYAKLHHSAGEVAVIVQQLVQARVAGVMFTANPVTGDTNQLCVEAVAGLGETLVQGLATPESWTLAKQEGNVLSHSNPFQPTQLIIESSGTREVPNTLEAPYLSAQKLSELVGLGATIEQHFGRPQDIEWVLEDNQLYILQSRPITTL